MINDNSNNYNIGKERFFNVIRDNFDKWDKNKDSYISDDELESRMNDKI